MLSKYIALFLIFGIACNYINSADRIKQVREYPSSATKNPYKKISDIQLPDDYTRLHSSKMSFGEWLRNIDLKKDKTVYKFNETRKTNQNAQFAVLNISVGKQDLQQCADAVMRLRAEY